MYRQFFQSKTFIIVFIDCITIPQHCMKVSQEIGTPQIKNKYCAQKTLNFRAKYKTQKCKYLLQQGYCPYGDMCAFAHDCLEMRNKAELHDHYKTKPCINFNKAGYCRYGDRCLFQHFAGRDRERTRSNSPQENESACFNQFKMRHQTNLKILSNYGFGVFQAYMNRKSSKVIEWASQQIYYPTTISDSDDKISLKSQSTCEWNSGWNNQEELSPDRLTCKKSRMYSL